MYELNRELLFLFKHTKGISNLQVLKLIENIKKLKAQNFQFSPTELAHFAELKDSTATFLESFRQLNIEELLQKEKLEQYVSILDPQYPKMLKEIYNPPTVLFFRGDFSLTARPCLSVVGSRDMSELGVKSVNMILSPLTKYFVVVSGLATGIDSIAHKVTLGNNGRTIAVIGTGLDVFYPKHHELLQKHIAKNHLVLSEYPSGTSPRKHHFPERNRIIAGLSAGTVVFEAKMRSGSLITCERAMESGREVFAVPSEILSGRSSGCHHLIQEGAKCTYTYKDVLEELLVNL
ncbi:DNA processing protein [Pilibacter termitis]|uniref:DNA processing protein n=1 Tax=Pilibacter termitis TaxID=263852 RepID=A0A1T4Q9H6_9ENTE|nr:DNA-processing protein DprA [Pilibacter termitis]SKA00181.1 DNA processing protein [Pilibacter termitis]